MDVFDLLPSEVAPAIDKHAYDFLREQGFDVDGAASSVKKQRATRKAMRRKSQTLGIKWNGYEDSRKRGQIILWFELRCDDGTLVARSKGMKFIMGKDENDGRKNG